MPHGTKVGLGAGDIVLDGEPSARKRGTAPPTFWPISVVAKRSPISATVEHLYNTDDDDSECLHELVGHVFVVVCLFVC